MKLAAQLSFSFLAAATAAVTLGSATLVGCGDSGGSGGSNGGNGGAATSSNTGGTGSTTGSTSSGGGSGGQGGQGTPIDTTPITADKDTWTYIPVTGSECMDGSEAAIGINKHDDAADLVIDLEGGNACFNTASCAIVANPKGYPESAFNDDVSGQLKDTPIFDRSAATNPLQNYNYVYVPYCTGDVHAGDNVATIAKAERHFHGFNNMTRFLARIVATYPNAKHVLLTGFSAGGFGAAFNYDQTVKAFGPNVEVNLLDDSGPPMAKAYVPACLQKFFVDTWGLAKTTPPECKDGCVDSDGSFMEPLVSYLTTTYTKQHIGLISSTSDKTISLFWGYGNDDCKAGFDGLPQAYAAGEYEMGLQDIRDRVAESDANFTSYYIDDSVHSTMIDGDAADTHHTWLTDSAGYGITVDGTALSSWFADFVADKNPKSVGAPAK